MSGIWLLIAPVPVHSFLLLLFVVTEGCVVLCGNPKKQPRTSSIVQFVFFVWFFEISGNILRNQDFLCLDPCILNRFTLFGPHLD